MKKQTLTQHALLVGAFVVILYVICLLWRYLLTDPNVIIFHQISLMTAFPGFKGYDLVSILWGGVLSFIYGFIASVVVHKLHGKCCL